MLGPWTIAEHVLKSALVLTTSPQIGVLFVVLSYSDNHQKMIHNKEALLVDLYNLRE